MDHSTLVCDRRAEYPDIQLTPQIVRARLRLQCTDVQASMLGVVWKEGFSVPAMGFVLWSPEVARVWSASEPEILTAVFCMVHNY